MRNRRNRRVTARYMWDRMRVSFWFAPVVMSIAAILLAWGMYWIDTAVPNELLATSRLILAGTPGELRSMLIGMAGTILATAGVVFTLLTLPLSTVAAQYGSRLLRVFLGDRTTQFVLGMFVATFVYCLAAALSIPPAEIEPEGPQLTATMGVLLMLGAFSSLIVLVQHISTMLQAPNIAAAAGAELRDVVLAEIPADVRRNTTSQADPQALSILQQSDGYPIHLNETGYIELIDPDTVIALVEEKDLLIRLLRKPGHFIRPTVVVAMVWPSDKVDNTLENQLRNAFRVGNTRTPTQDILYGINQLVEMAVRAMSPAINDPFTAMTCLDYLGESLALFIRHGENQNYYYDQQGKVRLVLDPLTFEELLSAAFDMLRHASASNASVLLHILEVIDVISQGAQSPEARQLLLHQVNLIQLESQAGDLIEPDRQEILHQREVLGLKLKEAR